jgi:hypothetical protein
VGIVSDLSILSERSRVSAGGGSAFVVLGAEEDGRLLVEFCTDRRLGLRAFYRDEPDVFEDGVIYVTASDGLSGHIAVNAEDMYVEAPASSEFGEIKESVNEKAPSLWMPFLAEDEGVTTGDLLTEYPRNPLAPIYGELPRMVLGVDGLLGTGDFIRSGRRTVKGVAGYDLTGLFVGSGGRLGLVTRVRFRLWAQPSARAVWAAGSQFEAYPDGKLFEKRIVPFYSEGRAAVYAEGRSERLEGIKKELEKTTGIGWDEIAAGDAALEILNQCYTELEPVIEKNVNADRLVTALGGPFNSAVPDNPESV